MFVFLLPSTLVRLCGLIDGDGEVVQNYSEPRHHFQSDVDSDLPDIRMLLVVRVIGFGRYSMVVFGCRSGRVALWVLHSGNSIWS